MTLLSIIGLCALCFVIGMAVAFLLLRLVRQYKVNLDSARDCWVSAKKGNLNSAMCIMEFMVKGRFSPRAFNETYGSYKRLLFDAFWLSRAEENKRLSELTKSIFDLKYMSPETATLEITRILDAPVTSPFFIRYDEIRADWPNDNGSALQALLFKSVTEAAKKEAQKRFETIEARGVYERYHAHSVRDIQRDVLNPYDLKLTDLVGRDLVARVLLEGDEFIAAPEPPPTIAQEAA